MKYVKTVCFADYMYDICFSVDPGYTISKYLNDIVSPGKFVAQDVYIANYSIKINIRRNRSFYHFREVSKMVELGSGASVKLLISCLHVSPVT